MGTVCLTMLVDGLKVDVREGLSCDAEVVVLAHGMFSNRETLSGLAQQLNSKGLETWCFDFRGHGESDREDSFCDYDVGCIRDVGIIIRSVLKNRADCKIHWVGHSGGGLAVLMYLAKYPHHCAHFKSLTLIASQASKAAVGIRGYLGLSMIKHASHLFNSISGSLFGLGPEYESSSMIRQWCNWNLNDAWVSSDGFDYMKALKEITTPALVLWGEGDTFIAPKVGCETIYDSIGSSIKHLKVCGISQGYLEDYSHSRIVRSSSAASEIWPVVDAWINQ